MIASEAGAIFEGQSKLISGATNYATLNGITGSGTPTAPSATTPHLSYSDSDNTNEQRQYRITTAPVNGDLTRSGVAISVGSAFTQEDLDNGLIQYKHKGSENFTDSFNYLVSDGDYTANETNSFAQGVAATPALYRIELLPTNDAPTITAPSSAINIVSSTPANNSITGFNLNDPDLATISAGETDFVHVTVRLLNANGTAFLASDYTGIAIGITPGSASLNATHNGTNDYLAIQGTKADVNTALATLTLTFPNDRNIAYKVQAIVDDRLRDNTGTLTSGANGGTLNQNPVATSAPTAILNTEPDWYSTIETGIPSNLAPNMAASSVVVRASLTNEAATLTGPGTQTVNEDQTTFINGFSVADPESTAFGLPVTVTFTVPNGTLGIAGTGTQTSTVVNGHTLTLTGDGTGTLTVSGQADDIQALINNASTGLTYSSPTDGNHDYNGAATGDVTLTVSLDDNSSRLGANAASTSPANNPASLSIPIVITAVNDKPAVAASGIAVAINASGSPTAITGFAISDKDIVGDNGGVISGEELDFIQAIVRITDSSGNPLPLTSYASITISSSSAPATSTTAGAEFEMDASFNGSAQAVVVRGTLANVNAYLSGLTLTYTSPINDPSAANLNATYRLQVIADDRLRVVNNGGANDGQLNGSTKANGGLNSGSPAPIVVPTNEISIYSDTNSTVLAANYSLNNVAINATNVFVSSINDPAKVTASNVSVNEANATVVFNASNANFVVTDPDSNGGLMSGSLTVNKGTITGFGSVSANITGVNSSTVNFSGITQTELNTRLQTVTVTLIDDPGSPTSADWNGSFTATLVVNDEGNTGQRPATLTGDTNNPTANDGDFAYFDGTSAKLTTTRTINVTVNPVNDAPIRTDANPVSLAAVLEDVPGGTGTNPPGDTVNNLFSSKFNDSLDTIANGSTANTFAGIAITTNAASVAQGTWQYSSDQSSWTALPTVSTAAALLLKPTDYLRFVPAANYNGSPGALTARLVDSSGSAITTGTTANVSNDTSFSGGITRYSSSTNAVVLNTSVTPVNDPPVGTNKNISLLINSPGYTVKVADFGFTDPLDTPANSFLAIKLTSVPPATEGIYKLNGTLLTGTETITVADINANKLVFIPAANATGSSMGALGLKVQDNGGGADTDLTAKILNFNIAVPIVSIAVSPATVTESGTPNLIYSITLDKAPAVDTVINFTKSGTATTGTDFTATVNTTSVTILAGQTTATITVDPTPDSLVEPDETVILTLSNGTGYVLNSDPLKQVATGTITDSNLPVATISLTPSSVLEDGTPNLVYTITLDQAAAKATTVNINTTGTATAGTDYSGKVTSVSFAPGESQKTITIDPTVDTIDEPDETVIQTLTAGTGYTLGTTISATGTITNDDLPIASIAVSPATVIEDKPNVLTYTISLNKAPILTNLVINLTTTGTAVSNDYTGKVASVTIPIGQTTATVVIDPTTDSEFENNETVVITLATGTGYSLGTAKTATGTIVNDDLAPYYELPNQPPVANDLYAKLIPSNAGPTVFGALSGSDVDGKVVSYTIKTLPDPSQGILYLQDGKTPVQAGQVMTADQAAGLTFAPKPTFTGNSSFTFTITDNLGAIDTTPATVTLPVANMPPEALDGTSPRLSINAGPSDIGSLQGTDKDGKVVSFTLVTLPAEKEGILYLSDGKTPATVGKVLNPDEAAHLKFAPKSGFVGTSQFTFTVTDNLGAVDATPAIYRIQVGICANEEIIDGVEVETITDNMLVVPIVLPNRVEDSNTQNKTLADIPVITNTQGKVLLAVSVPEHVGFTAQELVAGCDDFTLRELIITHTEPLVEPLTAFNDIVQQGIDRYLPTVVDERQVLVRSLVFSQDNEILAATPIIVKGSDFSGQPNSNQQKVVIIDAHTLAAGTTIQLDDIDFAIVIGNVQLVGGLGNNFVIGDDNLHVFSAGVKNDVLVGGSLADRLDIGSGLNLIDGAAGSDTLVYNQVGGELAVYLTKNTANSQQPYNTVLVDKGNNTQAIFRNIESAEINGNRYDINDFNLPGQQLETLAVLSQLLFNQAPGMAFINQWGSLAANPIMLVSAVLATTNLGSLTNSQLAHMLVNNGLGIADADTELFLTTRLATFSRAEVIAVALKNGAVLDHLYSKGGLGLISNSVGSVSLMTDDSVLPTVTKTEQLPLQPSTHVHSGELTIDGTLVEDRHINKLLVPIVTAARFEDPTTEFKTLADIPVIRNGKDIILQVSLPVGVGFTAEEIVSESGHGLSLRELLIASTEPRIEPLSVYNDMVKTGIDTYLATVEDPEQVTVRTIIFNQDNTTMPNQAIVIHGTLGKGEDDTSHPLRQEAVIIDAHTLAAGTTIQLDNIEFAVVIGNVKVISGQGSNFVVGDDAVQVFSLGEKNDTLIGSVGDDRLEPGKGNDLIDGGAGKDTLVYSMAATDHLQVKLTHSTTDTQHPYDTVVINTSTGEKDVFRNIEMAEINDQRVDINYLAKPASQLEKFGVLSQLFLNHAPGAALLAELAPVANDTSSLINKFLATGAVKDQVANLTTTDLANLLVQNGLGKADPNAIHFCEDYLQNHSLSELTQLAVEYAPVIDHAYGTDGINLI